MSSLSQSSSEAAVSDLSLKLRSAPEPIQLQLIKDLQAAGASGCTVLMEFLLERSAVTEAAQPNLVQGAAYQALFSANLPEATAFLQMHFPTGVVPLRSTAGIDYALLQQKLAEQDFQAADQLTLQKLCELAGPTAVQRKWVYFTEVEQFAIVDLQTINALWLMHSEGKFGFSIQREIWLSLGKNWNKLWSKIGWKSENNWTRYPQEFTWNLSAPRGHLPLSNQLRGVRVIASLLGHPAWSKPYTSPP